MCAGKAGAVPGSRDVGFAGAELACGPLAALSLCQQPVPTGSSLLALSVASLCRCVVWIFLQTTADAGEQIQGFSGSEKALMKEE